MQISLSDQPPTVKRFALPNLSAVTMPASCEAQQAGLGHPSAIPILRCTWLAFTGVTSQAWLAPIPATRLPRRCGVQSASASYHDYPAESLRKGLTSTAIRPSSFLDSLVTGVCGDALNPFASPSPGVMPNQSAMNSCPRWHWARMVQHELVQL